MDEQQTRKEIADSIDKLIRVARQFCDEYEASFVIPWLEGAQIVALNGPSRMLQMMRDDMGGQ